jgi:GT2 family glycosyltransferase
VILAYLEQPWLERAVDAVLDSEDVDIDLVVVDNGCTDGGVERVEKRAGVRIVRPEHNLGFAGGCNFGLADARGDFIALVNSDAIVDRHALARLAAVANDPAVGIASGSIRLADDPQRMNSAGNPFQFLGLVWAGGLGDPADQHTTKQPVACASGAGLVMRRELWQDLGGFAEEYFAYHEDAELSLRCWMRGLRVQYVPDAVVLHHYEFSRNARKFYLIERNRLVLLFTAYQRRTLAVIFPVLLMFELAMMAVAARQGWLKAKLSGYRWLLAHRSWLRSRRRLLQRERTCGDRALAPMWNARIDPVAIALPPGSGVLNAGLAAYWAVVRRLL